MSVQRPLLTVLLLIGLCNSLTIYAQYKTTPEFASYMKAVQAQQILTPAQVKQYIPADQNIDSRQFQAMGMTFRSKAYTQVLLMFNCEVAMYCEGSLTVHYNNATGDIVGSTHSISQTEDCDNKYSLETEFSNESLVVTVESKWQGKCGKFDNLFDDYTVREYEILASGEINLTRTQVLAQGRDYPDVSIRLFTELEMEDYKAKELTAMKNELLASYGFKFPDAKLAKLFSKKDWYEPKVDQVPESAFSYIEKRNIDLIRKYE